MTQAFMSALWGDSYDPEEHGHLVIWKLSADRKGGLSTWCDNIEDVVKSVDGKPDVYLHITTHKKPDGDNKILRKTRGTNVSAVAAAAVALDLDYKSGVHAKTSLPTKEVCIKLLDVYADFSPSCIIHTGHGFQAWWFFDEPTTEFKDFFLDWQRIIKIHAGKQGYEVDATHDAARVFRVPGTINAKRPEKQIPVTIHTENYRQRYSIIDMQEFADDYLVKNPEEKSFVQTSIFDKEKAPEITVSKNFGVPAKKFKVACDNSPEFKKTWENKRKDFLKDTSASVYDMSLADYVCMIDGPEAWTDQEICNLLIAHRVEHGHKDKPTQYYQRTIQRAREFTETRKKELESEEAIEDYVSLGTLPSKNKERSRIIFLEHISTKLHIGIKSISKYLTDPPTFRMCTEVGNIEIPDVTGLISQAKFRANLAAATNRLLEKQQPQMWQAIAQLLLDCCENIDVGEESTNEGMMKSRVEAYLMENPPRKLCEEIIKARDPFTDSGFVHINAEQLKKFINMSEREFLTVQKLTPQLRNIGWTNTKINKFGQQISYWRIKKEMM